MRKDTAGLAPLRAERNGRFTGSRRRVICRGFRHQAAEKVRFGENLGMDERAVGLDRDASKDRTAEDLEFTADVHDADAEAGTNQPIIEMGAPAQPGRQRLEWNTEEHADERAV